MRIATTAACGIGLAFISAVQAGDIAARSEVAGFRIAATAALPAPEAPQRFRQDDFCRNVAIEPETPAGRHAAALGWYVTSEAEAAGYTAVGIFSRGDNATSGTCLISDGNVVLYRDETPVAIVYEPPHPENEGGLVGGVVPTLTAGRLRISDWTPPGFVHADIELRPDAVRVVPVAALETACGSIGLPNIRGMDVPAARRALAPHGWKPADFNDQGDDNPHDYAARLRKDGLSEFETCSGTGYGFCAVRYTHPGGAVLDITTTGDEPAVSSYSVRCPDGHP